MTPPTVMCSMPDDRLDIFGIEWALTAMTDRWSATERIFNAALERPVEARAAFLAEACGDDAALRLDVQSLLDAASSTGFLEQPALQIAAGLVTSATLAPSPVNASGSTASPRCWVAAAWARSTGRAIRASGATWRSRCCRRPSPPAPIGWRASNAKRACTASLNHPHIGMLSARGERRHTALVLELVEGETLAERRAAGRSRSSRR